MTQEQHPSPEPPRPALMAMLVCDQAIREAGTNKVTLVGIFDRIFSPVFPFDWVRGAAACARLTDAQGVYNMRIELVRLEDEQAVGKGDFQVTVEDRMRVHEITMEFSRLRFERSGKYEFRLFANDRYLGGVTLDVVQLEPQEGRSP